MSSVFRPMPSCSVCRMEASCSSSKRREVRSRRYRSTSLLRSSSSSRYTLISSRAPSSPRRPRRRGWTAYSTRRCGDLDIQERPPACQISRMKPMESMAVSVLTTVSSSMVMSLISGKQSRITVLILSRISCLFMRLSLHFLLELPAFYFTRRRARQRFVDNKDAGQLLPARAVLRHRAQAPA